MNDYDEPFVYDESSQDVNNTKMYNRGFIMSYDERLTLEKWANELFLHNKLDPMSNGRFERKIKKNDVEMIPLVFEIQDRIEKREQLTACEKETVVSDFITLMPKNGFIHKHCDPNDVSRNLFHIRFNIFITLPKKGGTTYYGGRVVDARECCYAMSRSGVDYHWSDINEDDIPRISLSFGYLTPPEKVDMLSTIGTYSLYYPLTTNKPISEKTIAFEERGGDGSSIFTISNIFTDEQCQRMQDFILKYPSLWGERDLNYTNNVECKFLILKELIELNIPGASDLDNLIFKAVNMILVKLREIRPYFKGTNDDGYTLRKIFGKTKQHADGIHSKASGFTKFVRCLSLIIVLNDDYDGGVFCFPNQGLKFRVQKGQAILFPPYWTHPHSVTSVGEGQSRYTINTWILEKYID